MIALRTPDSLEITNLKMEKKASPIQLTMIFITIYYNYIILVIRFTASILHVFQEHICRLHERDDCGIFFLSYAVSNPKRERGAIILLSTESLGADN